jgi:hypothetical protein
MHGRRGALTGIGDLATPNNSRLDQSLMTHSFEMNPSFEEFVLTSSSSKKKCMDGKANCSIRIISSSTFTFIIGEEKKPFTVHADAIAKLSQPLNNLINGHMSEAQTGTATLEDVRVDTFIRVCQFAYCGDYETPAHIVDTNPNVKEPKSNTPARPSEEDAVPIEGESAQTAEELPQQVDDSGEWPSRRRKLPVNARLRASFTEKKYPTKHSALFFLFKCKPRRNKLSTENYTPVFLAHARLYVFADKYCIESLRMLALDKLHHTLSVFKLSECRIPDVVELIRYVYADGNTPDLEDGIDGLRDLVTHYVACENSKIGNSRLFTDLLEEGGPFVRDFWALMVKWIS